LSATLLETIQRIVQDELARVRTAELGIVQEQHPHASDSDKDNYSCSVLLRDSKILLRSVPVATDRIGQVSIPAVGEMVLVQFVGGSIHAPVITGRLYNDEERPPANQDGQFILHVPLGAGESDAVHFEISSGDKRAMLLQLGSGLKLQLQDDDPVVEVETDGGSAKIRIDRDGAVTVESQGKLKMNASEISIEAQGNLKLKGARVDIN
jgi:uncharacterized protein involved in type VI secretion and phage assembly